MKTNYREAPEGTWERRIQEASMGQYRRHAEFSWNRTMNLARRADEGDPQCEEKIRKVWARYVARVIKG